MTKKILLTLGGADKKQCWLALALCFAASGAMSHVGETVPYRWTARLHMSTVNGQPNTTDTVTWKVPVATFQGAYDDSRLSPLAVPLPTKPAPSSLTPLTLTLPQAYEPLCVLNPYIKTIQSPWGEDSTTHSYLCDTNGSLAKIFPESATPTRGGFHWIFQRLMALDSNCIAADVEFSPGCSSSGEGSYFPGFGVDPCTVSVSVPGHDTITVAGVSSGAGTISLPDFWYMARTPREGASNYICPENSQTWTCDSAGTIPGCAYYGLQDAYDKSGLIMPLTLAEIREVTARRHATLANQVSNWFVPMMDEQQLGVGFFSYLMTNVLVRTGGTGLDVTKWSTAPAEIRWTTYMDNTSLDKVGTAGRNAASTYGQTQVRRLDNDMEVRYLYCRYGSGTMEYLPPTWGLPDAGYLSCSAWGRDVSMPSGTILSENIFFDSSKPDTARGLNLVRAYDDTQYAEDELCPEDGCAGPFEDGGVGYDLIRDYVVPAMGRWAADMAILDYSSAQRVSDAELSDGNLTQTYTAVNLSGGGFVSSSIGQQTETNTGEPDEYGEDMMALMKYGMSWSILDRHVSFPSCGAGPITMNQRWRWEADNSLGQLQWDVYRSIVDAEGNAMAGDVTGSAASHEGDDSNVAALRAQGRYGDWTTERSGVPVPLAGAMWVPYNWMTSAIYLYKDYIYTGMIPGLHGSWVGAYYPALSFNVSDVVLPSGQFAAAPYMVLDPYNYPNSHPGYYRMIDARDSDVIPNPLNVAPNPHTLNHAFLRAPYSNGTVSGQIYQTRNIFNCRKQEKRTVCVREETQQDCKIVDGVEECVPVTVCLEKMTYMACTEYDCRRDYCAWPMTSTGAGSWAIEIEEESCAAHPAIKDYLDRGWLPPASAHGAQDAGGSSNLTDYVAAQERAAIDSAHPDGYRKSGIVPSTGWGGHGRKR